MPSTTVPLPAHIAHSAPSISPEPAQSGQTFSPVPGVPGGASSPGAIAAWVGSSGGVGEGVLMPCGVPVAAPGPYQRWCTWGAMRSS